MDDATDAVASATDKLTAIADSKLDELQSTDHPDDNMGAAQQRVANKHRKAESEAASNISVSLKA